MNQKRRKRIATVSSKLQELLDELNLILEEEQEAYDNMPEQLQDTERGEAMYEAIETLEDAISEIEGQMDELDNLC